MYGLSLVVSGWITRQSHDRALDKEGGGDTLAFSAPTVSWALSLAYSVEMRSQASLVRTGLERRGEEMRRVSSHTSIITSP